MVVQAWQRHQTEGEREIISTFLVERSSSSWLSFILIIFHIFSVTFLYYFHHVYQYITYAAWYVSPPVVSL